MSAWLFTILRNHFRSEYRKRRREVEDGDGHHVDSLKSPPQQHSRVEFEEFRRALAKLLPDQREALILVGGSGFSYEEAAAICESAVGTIKSRVNRARARLSKSALHRQRRHVRPGPHDACRSERGRARLIGREHALAVATSIRRRCVWILPTCRPVKPHGRPFFRFPTALPNGREKLDLPLRSGIAIVPPPRPAFVGGKGSPCEKEKGRPP